MLRRGFEPRSWAREALEKRIDYSKDRKNFIIWMKERCSTGHTDDMVKYLDRYLTTKVSNPRQLFELIGTVEKGKRHFYMAIRDLLKYYEIFSLMDEASLIKYRKVVKIPKTNIDNYIPEDEKSHGKRFSQSSTTLLNLANCFSPNSITSMPLEYTFSSHDTSFKGYS